MRRRRVIMSGMLIVVGLLVQAGVSASATTADETEITLITQALIASGVEPGSEQLESERLAIQQALTETVWRVGTGKPSYRRAYKLQRVLHRNYLKSYDITVDNVGRVAQDGTYNCLSGVLFFGLAAERLGFDTRVIEYPGHLLLELDVRGGPVLIETTSPFGFDVSPSRLLSYGSASSFGRGWLVMPPESSWSVPLSAAVGFTWLNRAWRTFERGNVAEAVAFVDRAAEHVPDLAERVEAAPRLLARAFAKEYDAGRFDSAYRIATLQARLDPRPITTQDRVLAAAQKRIEQLCAAGFPAKAAAIREELDGIHFEPVALALFDRTVSPAIISAAVRLDEWGVAEEYVRRHAASEPDAVERERLRAWVESRRDEKSPLCSGLRR